MSHLYELLIKANQAHWKAHANAYPLKFLLTPDQHKELEAARLSIRDAVVGKNVPGHEPMKFHGTPLEVHTDTPGEMVALDGTSTPLTDYALPPRA